MTPEIINPKKFWSLYFSDRFLRLRNNSNKYIGEIFDKEISLQNGDLFNEKIIIEINTDNLHLYPYIKDGCFSLLTKRPQKAKDAIRAIINKSYPYRDAAPFSKAYMAELFFQAYPKDLENKSLQNLEQTTLTLAQYAKQELSQLLTAHVWLLGELRQRSSSKALLTIIHNASFVSTVNDPLHFSTVDTAFSALWKVNDKSSLFELLSLLRKTSEDGKEEIIPLFERLLSTNKLLSLSECGDNYYNIEFWENYLAPMKHFNEYEWDVYDANSLFWEIRYLAAMRLPLSDIKTLTQLAKDEVKTVSNMAKERLVIQ